MQSDYKLTNGHTDEHDSSPVCVVLRRYFSEQAKRQEEIEQQRRGSEMHNPRDLIGGNDVVQEG